MNVYILEHSYQYQGSDEICICATFERAEKEAKIIRRRPEYNGAGVRMPAKRWKRKSPSSWLREGKPEQWLSIRTVEVLE